MTHPHKHGELGVWYHSHGWWWFQTEDYRLALVPVADISNYAPDYQGPFRVKLWAGGAAREYKNEYSGLRRAQAAALATLRNRLRHNEDQLWGAGVELA